MASALALGAALALAPPAAPSPPEAPVPFLWEAPEGCPSGDDVRAKVEQHLGGPLDEVALESWSVHGVVEPGDDGGWRLALTIETPDGRNERPLQDPKSCEIVSDSAALLIALALDPEAGQDEPPTASGSSSAGDAATTEPETEPAAETSKPEPPPEPPAPEPPEPPPPPEPDLRRDVPLVFAFGFAGGIDWGTLRNVSPIGRANFAWQLPKVRVGASVTSGAAPRFTIPPLSEEITLWAWTVGVEAGPVFRVGPVELPLIGGLEVGQLVVWPRELLDPTRQQVTWAALLVTPGVAYAPVPWLALVARVGATVSLVRPSFSVEGIGSLHAPRPVGVRATLGVEFRLPLSVTGAGRETLPRREAARPKRRQGAKLRARWGWGPHDGFAGVGEGARGPFLRMISSVRI